eukprot:5866995-Pleurochrysis_carterae.AAC.6
MSEHFVFVRLSCMQNAGGGGSVSGQRGYFESSPTLCRQIDDGQKRGFLAPALSEVISRLLLL